VKNYRNTPPPDYDHTISLNREGFSVNKKGEKLTNQETAARVLGVSEDTICERLKRHPDFWRQEGHYPNIIRKFDEIKLAVRDLIATTISIRSTEFYIDNKEDHYGSTHKIAKELGISVTAVRRRCPEVKSLQARVNGAIKNIYRLEDFTDREDIQQKLNPEIKVDENGYFLDPETGDKWCTIETYWNSLTDEDRKGTSKTAVHKRVKKNNCEFKNIISKTGEPGTKIYKVKDIEKYGMERKNAEIKVDKTTGIYTSPEGKRYASILAWTTIKGVKKSVIYRGLRVSDYNTFEEVPHLVGLNIRGTKQNLFEESVIDELISIATK